MEQSRSRFPTRRRSAREGEGKAGSGKAGDVDRGDLADDVVGADSKAGFETDFETARRADAWEPFDSAEAAKSTETGAYTRSSEQNAGRSKRRADPDDSQFESEKPKRSLKGRALGYLSRREYSRVELKGKLGPYVEETDNLESLLDALESEGWLSDTRFAESLMHRRANRFGASRIVGELKRHALDGELLEQLGTQLRDTEAARAQAVWQKKFGELPRSPAERAKQTRFLAARGFSHAAIIRLLRGLDDESDFSGDDAAD